MSVARAVPEIGGCTGDHLTVTLSTDPGERFTPTLLRCPNV